MLLNNNRITLLYNFSQPLFLNPCQKCNTVYPDWAIMARLAGLIKIYSTDTICTFENLELRLCKHACVLLITDFVDRLQKNCRLYYGRTSCRHAPKAATSVVERFERGFFAPV